MRPPLIRIIINQTKSKSTAIKNIRATLCILLPHPIKTENTFNIIQFNHLSSFYLQSIQSTLTDYKIDIHETNNILPKTLKTNESM
nr:MAG TPA: hypothetical protein [Caudoviricetes sp.]